MPFYIFSDNFPPKLCHSDGSETAMGFAKELVEMQSQPNIPFLDFFVRVSDLHDRLNKSNLDIPPTTLMEMFLKALMASPELEPKLITFMYDFMMHIAKCGPNIAFQKTPLDVFRFLEFSGFDINKKLFIVEERQCPSKNANSYEVFCDLLPKKIFAKIDKSPMDFLMDLVQLRLYPWDSFNSFFVRAIDLQNRLNRSKLYLAPTILMERILEVLLTVPDLKEILSVFIIELNTHIEDSGPNTAFTITPDDVLGFLEFSGYDTHEQLLIVEGRRLYPNKEKTGKVFKPVISKHKCKICYERHHSKFCWFRGPEWTPTWFKRRLARFNLNFTTKLAWIQLYQGDSFKTFFSRVDALEHKFNQSKLNIAPVTLTIRVLEVLLTIPELKELLLVFMDESKKHFRDSGPDTAFSLTPKDIFEFIEFSGYDTTRKLEIEGGVFKPTFCNHICSVCYERHHPKFCWFQDPEWAPTWFRRRVDMFKSLHNNNRTNPTCINNDFLISNESFDLFQAR